MRYAALGTSGYFTPTPIRSLLELSNIESPVRSSPGTGGLPYRLSGHRNGSRSRNGFLVWYRHINYTTQSNSHCDVKSRVVKEVTKVYAFLVRESSTFGRPEMRCCNISSFCIFVKMPNLM